MCLYAIGVFCIDGVKGKKQSGVVGAGLYDDCEITRGLVFFVFIPAANDTRIVA